MILLVVMFLLAFTTSAWANPACAVCTIAVGASLEIARSLGVDNSVVGVWAGGFLALLGYWLILWFEKKGWRFWGRDVLSMVISVGAIGFMYISEMKYSPIAIGIFYLDPFLFSTLLGAFILIYSSKFYQWMKARNGGHAHFPFEKVVVPVVALAAASAYFYFYPLCQTAVEAASAAELYSF